jgi:uncharacterized protein YndB with AHSA1/START domain
LNSWSTTKATVITIFAKSPRWVPQKKIAYTWRYKGEPGESLVTFELTGTGDQTKLRLTHEGLQTFPAKSAYARKNFEAGWTAIAGELKKFVEGQSVS